MSLTTRFMVFFFCALALGGIAESLYLGPAAKPDHLVRSPMPQATLASAR